MSGKTLVTVFGRKKRHWVVTRENLHALQNEASNFPHQSTASDITLVTANTLAEKLRNRGVWIVNLVHDEILVECPNDPELIEWTKNVIIETAQRIPLEWGLNRVPFKAEGDVGRRWGIYRRVAKK